MAEANKIRPPRDLLTDGVVSLRLWRPDDVPVLVEACQDPDIPRWTTVPSPYTEKDARGYVLQAARFEGPEYAFAITDATDGAVLGAIGLRVSRRHLIGEIGYWIASWERRRGVATRGVRLIATWAVRELGLERIQLTTHDDNRASQGVALKAGFTREGVLRSWREVRGKRHDLVMFSLLPKDL